MAFGRKKNRFSCVSAQSVVAPYCPVGEALLVTTWILSFFFGLERDNSHHLVFFLELHSIALAHTNLSHKSACSSNCSSVHQFIWPFRPFSATFCKFLQHRKKDLEETLHIVKKYSQTLVHFSRYQGENMFLYAMYILWTCQDLFLRAFHLAHCVIG